MKSVNKSVLLWYSAEEMFNLVVDVNSYPQFLPWCDHGKVITDSATGMKAEVGIALGAVKQIFTTQNTHAIHATGRQIAMTLINGPFSKLEGTWDFTHVGNGSQRACKTTLNLKYDFDNAVLAALVGPVFDKIAASMVDAFVKRANQVYG